MELLAAGPLVAATGAGPQRTAIVAGYAVVLSVPLGLVGDAFGSVQHVVGILAVGIVGALAVALSRHRAPARGPARARARRARTPPRARDELEAMLSGIADAVTGQAPDGSLIYANDAALSTLGFESREELLDTPPGEILARFDLYEESGAPFPPERAARPPGAHRRGRGRGDHPLPGAGHRRGALVGREVHPGPSTTTASSEWRST